MDRDIQLSTPTPSRPALPDWLACGLLLSITLALYASVVYFEFVWDDTAYIRENFRIHALDWIHLKSVLTKTYLGHYAPFHHLLLALLYRIDGNVPFYFHLANVLIHMAAIVLLYALLKRIESAHIALLASLLFAVHPTHPETVAWVSESKSTLAFLLILASAWFFVRYAETGRAFLLAISVAFYVVSSLTKINTVVAPAVFVLYEYKNGKSLRELNWRAIGIFFVTSVALVVAHLQAFGPTEEMLDGMPYSPLGLRLMNLPMLLFFYLDSSVAPYSLSAWEQFPVQEAFTWVVGLAWAGLALMLFFTARASKPIQFWIGWFVVFLLPVLQFVPFPVWVADRYLYVPLVGVCVLLAKLFCWGLEQVGSNTKRVALGAGAVVVLLLFGWQAQRHVPIWRDDLSLWGATAPKCQQSPYCRSSYGLALMDAGRLQQGGNELVAAVALRPAPMFLAYLGDALTMSARNYPEAIRMYRDALRNAGKPGEDPFGSRNGMLLAKLARVYLKQGELDLAGQAIRLGAAYDFRNAQLATADTYMRWKLGDFESAGGSLQAVRLITGQRGNLESYLNHFWGDLAETRQMLREIQSRQP